MSRLIEGRKANRLAPVRLDAVDFEERQPALGRSQQWNSNKPLQ